MNMRWGHRGSRGASSVVCSNGQRRGNSTTRSGCPLALVGVGGWVGCGCVGARRYASVRVGARRCTVGLVWEPGRGGCGRGCCPSVATACGHRHQCHHHHHHHRPQSNQTARIYIYIYTEVIRARCDQRRRSCAGRASGVEGGRHPAVPTAFRDHGGPLALARPCPPRPPVLYIRIEHSNTVFRTRWLPDTSRRGSE